MAEREQARRLFDGKVTQLKAKIHQIRFKKSENAAKIQNCCFKKSENAAKIQNCLEISFIYCSFAPNKQNGGKII